MSYSDDVVRGIKIQNSLDSYERKLELDLKNSPIILRKPSKKIIHELKGNLNSDAEYVMRSTIGDHNTLMQCLLINFSTIPDKYQRIANFLKGHNPPSHIDAFKRAKVLGYNVNELHLQDLDVSYGEQEAYYAAWMMVSFNWSPGLLLEHSYWVEWRDLVYQKINFFTAQFIVPQFSGLDQYNYTPYIIDQLWVVRESDSTVRLIGVEVDGEHHLGSNEKQDRQRYERLTNMGYEMYHVAAWWCRVDPYRVISEVLEAADITPGLLNNFYFSEFKSINDYKCDICQNLGVRYEEDDLLANNRNRGTLVHRSCAENYYYGL